MIWQVGKALDRRNQDAVPNYIRDADDVIYDNPEQEYDIIHTLSFNTDTGYL